MILKPFPPNRHENGRTVMTSIVVLHGHQLCQAYRRLRFVAVALAVIAAASLPFIALSTRLVSASIVLVLGLAAYAAAKVYVAVKYTRAGKQLRLEERFLRDLPRGEKLAALLRHDHHLWSSSRLWMGLRSVLTHPLPHLLLVDEKRRRIERHFRRAIRGLQPRAFNWHLVGMLGMILLWDLTRTVDGASGGLLTVVGGAFAVILALEAVQTGIQWALGHQFEQLEKALCEWTLYHRFEQGVTSRDKSYTHQLLYQARPWFLAPGTRTIERTVVMDSRLREVA